MLRLIFTVFVFINEEAMAIFLIAQAVDGAKLPDDLGRSVASIVGSEVGTYFYENATLTVAARDLQLWPGESIAGRGNGIFSVIAGHPLVCVAGKAMQRGKSVDCVSHALQSEDLLALERCEGTFSGCLIDSENNTVRIVVDKLGVRPVYWALTGGVFYAASALWMLEKLSQLRKSCNWEACAEVAAFGYAMGDRTVYSEVNSLTPGSVLVSRSGRIEKKVYWDWRDPMWHGEDAGAELIESVEAAFKAAVADRVDGQQEVLSFLSGGMDSRFIASCLRECGVELHTLNFAPEGSADLVFGRMAAKALNAKHLEFGAGTEPFHVRMERAVSVWRQDYGASWSKDRKSLWSGDGGSVVLGHVYMDDEIVHAARNKGLSVAANLICSKNKYQLSSRVFSKEYSELSALPLRRVREELELSKGIDPARACHLFFVLNDQRKHLTAHFERVHERGFDFELPFFDGRFMKAVFRGKIDEFIAHRLYNKLFLHLPFGLSAVPWQSYPGHLPCPVEYYEDVRNQWADGWFDKGVQKSKSKEQVKRYLSLAAIPGFPDRVLSRGSLRLASFLTLLGLRDYSYLTNCAIPFLDAAGKSFVKDGLHSHR